MYAGIIINILAANPALPFIPSDESLRALGGKSGFTRIKGRLYSEETSSVLKGPKKGRF